MPKYFEWVDRYNHTWEGYCWSCGTQTFWGIVYWWGSPEPPLIGCEHCGY